MLLHIHTALQLEWAIHFSKYTLHKTVIPTSQTTDNVISFHCTAYTACLVIEFQLFDLDRQQLHWLAIKFGVTFKFAAIVHSFHHRSLPYIPR